MGQLKLKSSPIVLCFCAWGHFWYLTWFGTTTTTQNCILVILLKNLKLQTNNKQLINTGCMFAINLVIIVYAELLPLFLQACPQKCDSQASCVETSKAKTKPNKLMSAQTVHFRLLQPIRCHRVTFFCPVETLKTAWKNTCLHQDKSSCSQLVS